MESLSTVNKFYEHEKKFADQVFLRQPFGDRWEEYTWKQVGQMARKLATGLKSLGLKPKAHIGLVSKNCREWIIADQAISLAGYVSVPFFPTLTGDQIAEVIRLGDVDALFVGKLEVWDDMKKGIPADLPVIAFPHYEGNSKIDRGEQWHDFINRFEPLEENISHNANDLWTIVFTSGTTGTPKGVMLNYGARDELLTATTKTNPLNLSKEGDNHFFSFLPLNHIAERSIVQGGAIAFGGKISFSENLATFAQNLRDAQPTVFFAVPRIWTKFQLSILDKMPQKKLDLFLKIPILSGIIKKKLKTALGLNNSRCNVSGAAPIPYSTKQWFNKLGIPISEGYGMTENSAACTFLRAENDRKGSVGKAQGGVELKIDPETQEVLMKAPYVMTGYYNAPDLTAKVLKDGWLHTGDQGKIDKDGYLYLTGRVKDTFKTAKGEFITPAPIEFGFSNNTDIEQICLVGLGLVQPMAMVALSELGQAKSKDELKESLSSTLKEVNGSLANYQRISNIIVAKDPFTVENGLLTPTLKIKRSSMNEKYREKCEEWQKTKEPVIWE